MYTRWFGFTLQAMQAALASENVRKNSDFCVVKLTSAYCMGCPPNALTYTYSIAPECYAVNP